MADEKLKKLPNLGHLKTAMERMDAEFIDGDELAAAQQEVLQEFENHTHPYAGSSTAGGAATSAVKLETARTIRTNLSSAEPASFDGTDDATPGVTGILPVENGGTGSNSIDTTPTEGSSKLVTSGGTATALKSKVGVSIDSANNTLIFTV